jgi:uncharacterized repeat protein (TIGR01451 family)
MTTGMQTPSRYTRLRGISFDGKQSSADKTRRTAADRNYLRKLFAAGRPATVTTAPAVRDSQFRHVGHAESVPLKTNHNHNPLLAVPLSVQFAGRRGTSVTTGGLRYADFERVVSASQRDDVQQVRATDENISPFAAVDNGLEGQADHTPAADEPNRQQVSTERSLPLPEETDPPLTSTKQAPAKTTVGFSSGTASATDGVTGGFPVGPQTPMITLEWRKQSNINVGQECECQLHVTNSGKISAKNVSIDAYFPPTVRLTSATPTPADNSDHLTWTFAELAAGDTEVIRVRLIPSRRGTLTTTAFVTFTAAAGGEFRVNEPLLAVEVTGPQGVLIGDAASQVIKISNPGTGIATNVSLEAVIPAGLEHLRGERLSMEVGALNPGETRIVRLALASVSAGDQVLKVQVSADGDLREVTEKTVNVIAPSLATVIDGPETRYVGRAARYVVSVTNDGDVVSNNVRALYQMPNGFKFLRADNGGRFDTTRNAVSWFVGRMAPGETIQRAVFLTATGLGSVIHQATVTSEHGVTAEAELATRIEGTASLNLQIVEQNDPVEVGTETAFEVRVRNDGSKPAINVGLSIELPPGVKYQMARGPSEHLAANGLLVFKSIERLDPGKTAIYRVHIQGTTSGNHRIRARLASDSINEPLISEEVTKFHAE